VLAVATNCHIGPFSGITTHHRCLSPGCLIHIYHCHLFCELARSGGCGLSNYLNPPHFHHLTGLFAMWEFKQKCQIFLLLLSGNIFLLFVFHVNFTYAFLFMLCIGSGCHKHIRHRHCGVTRLQICELYVFRFIFSFTFTRTLKCLCTRMVFYFA
jgi:hypothetical protein